MSLILSFDIGYASIGWSVLSSKRDQKPEPDVLGVGAVTFPTDDCLASQRRGLRRTRRHIRSTRQRIERLKRWFLAKGILDREALDRPGHAAPFLLAAAALNGHRTLDAWELWNVLRWYAHNRGYDGNSRWAKGDESEEDTEKVQQAIALMKEQGTETMCETVTACLGLKPSEHDKRISSFLPYKTLNAAYPRNKVTEEVSRILGLHNGKISNLDSEAIRLILKESPLSEEERFKLVAAGVKLPKRFMGGLLFGQLIPRFDNRIIARCPITWATTYDDAIKAGEPDTKARKLADKFAKVPSAKCSEFFRFRFAMLIANFKVDDGKPISRDLRRALWSLGEKQGRLTYKDIVKVIKESGHKPYNLDAYFKIHPDSEDALTLDPIVEFPHKNQIVKGIWTSLSDETRDEVLDRWKKGGAVTPGELFEMSGKSEGARKAIEAVFDKDQKKAKGKRTYSTIQDLLDRKLSPASTSGRAPYARPVLRSVVEEVLSGPFHPLKASKATDPENGDDKAEDGVLYALGIPTSRVRQLQEERPLEKLTNNHLVRHRMLILHRLLDDIVAEFCTGSDEVGRVIVEVARELREFSGMTAKKIASELNSRLKDFKSAVAYLDKHAPNLEKSGGIIRKCRIAMDLDWRCPFTGEPYDAYDLPKLEREHIIPYATRNTNALHALVLTWPEINRMKGKRTARQFITDHEGKQVDGKANLSLFTVKQFDDFVEKLDTRGHPDDAKRKRARKALLLTTDFEDKELGFTDGQLTQSSHLMKLALRGLTKRFPSAICDPIPGPVTAEIRKSWRLTGTLALACPEIIDPETEKPRPKDEIRGLTHLHHALDAATLGLAAHYFPFQSRGQDQKGKIWQALLKRQRTAEEKDFLFKLGIFDRFERNRRDKQGKEFRESDVRLRDLPASLKDQIARSLAECRVMQHLPSDRSGAKAELTTWGVTEITGEGEDARVKLRQQTSTVEEGKRVIQLKTREERAGKLLGVNPKNGEGKLMAIRGAMIIGENYGLALDPEPTVIPFHEVQKRLVELRAANGGKPVTVLRNGMAIHLDGQGKRDGVWLIYTVQASLKIDLVRPGTYGRPKKGDCVWREVAVKGLLKNGLQVLPRRYTGYPLT